MSCSATAISSSSNFCSGLSTTFPALAGLVATGLVTTGLGPTGLATTALVKTGFSANGLVSCFTTAGFATGLVAAFGDCLITRAISTSPFHVRDGAGQFPGFCLQARHRLRVPAPFGLG